MSAISSSSIRNVLLSKLPPEELAKFSTDLERLELPKGFLIAAFNDPIDHVYFPDSGIGSVVAVSPEGNKAEAGMFGREGFSPVQAAVGAEISPHEIVMQHSGSGHRITSRRFLEAMECSPLFAHLVASYSQALAIQVTYTALSNVSHPVDERLARWLLMCHDRVDGDELNLTHEYISLMLAVRRPSVTTALHVLEGNRFIRSERGRILIRDRAALEEFARDAYGKPEQEYDRLIGKKDGSRPSNVVPLTG
ncbi:Transcriptional regulator, Crp family [Pseudorhizobium banfieldiae]|uniref:Transcriptional regulator, Crp family n=1 Tax=Pseudorhizobium banfieldiae TaxID=1125847 RepID=L0NC94_9HYPH|nr:Crp/Fnr family transcriptional regulator [Pseudorhizobium banfieldiae]CAD6603426.1 Crp/Fnr family transcriptional regulator [arsenite-oxidising bacterium NT-25]CCF18708.1 Transcriptional regulator, Crp family [Pseudorhizobium banfieldiae]